MTVNPRKIYLWICAVGLIPVALSYGVAPEQSLNWLFGLSVEIPNEIHIFRAVMGLYLGMVALWITGALDENYEHAAIVAVVFFMSGLAVGRILSLLVDGWPHWLLVNYTVVEVVLAVVGIILLKKRDMVSN